MSWLGWKCILSLTGGINTTPPSTKEILSGLAGEQPKKYDYNVNIYIYIWWLDLKGRVLKAYSDPLNQPDAVNSIVRHLNFWMIGFDKPVGGLEDVFSIYWDHPNWLSYFQRGRYTTNQLRWQCLAILEPSNLERNGETREVEERNSPTNHHRGSGLGGLPMTTMLLSAWSLLAELVEDRDSYTNSIFHL